VSRNSEAAYCEKKWKKCDNHASEHAAVKTNSSRKRYFVSVKLAAHKSQLAAGSSYFTACSLMLATQNIFIEFTVEGNRIRDLDFVDCSMQNHET
jgi:hypothetical protein